MNKFKWYIHQDRDKDDPGLNSYTLTLNPKYPGWKTDSGYGGYGLPKEIAQWICDRLNESNKKLSFNMDKYGCWKKMKSENELD